MKGKYQTVYEASYGTVVAVIKGKVTLSEAEELGEDYCYLHGFKYIRTEEVTK